MKSNFFSLGGSFVLFVQIWSASLLAGIFATALNAQAPVEPRGFTASAMAGATVALGGSAGWWENPAALGEQHRFRWLVFGEMPFGLPMLRTAGTMLAWGQKGMGVSVTAGAFGNGTYRGKQFGLHWGKKLSEKSALGMGVGYHDSKTALFARNSEVRIVCGGLLGLGEHWRIGAMVSKGIALQSAYASPWELRAGTVWSPSRTASLSLDMGISGRQRACWRLGALWRPVERIELACGFSSDPVSATLGAKFLFGQGRASMGTATRWHPDLGWSPSFEAGVHW
jgi:hypothetical protein